MPRLFRERFAPTIKRELCKLPIQRTLALFLTALLLFSATSQALSPSRLCMALSPRPLPLLPLPSTRLRPLPRSARLTTSRRRRHTACNPNCPLPLTPCRRLADAGQCTQVIELTTVRLVLQHVSDAAQIIGCVRTVLACRGVEHNFQGDVPTFDGRERLGGAGTLCCLQQPSDSGCVAVTSPKDGERFVLGQRIPRYFEGDLISLCPA